MSNTQTGLVPDVRFRTGDAGVATASVQLMRLAVFLLLIGLWWVSSLNSTLVPSPVATVSELVTGFVTGRVWPPLIDSVTAVVAGFSGAALVAVPLGIWLGQASRAMKITAPFISGLFAVPRVIVYPVLLVIFGVGLESKTWLAGISAFFPILLTSVSGSRSIPPILGKLARSLRCGVVRTYAQVYLRSALPSVLVGLRIGASLAFVAVIVAELFAATEGLGLMVQSTYALQQYPQMFSVVLLITILALVVNGLFAFIDRRFRYD